VAFVSEGGLVPSGASAAAPGIASRPAPASAASTAPARSTVGPMLARAMRALPTPPLERSTTAATATMPQSWLAG